MMHREAPQEEIDKWIDQAKGYGCTHILSISDIRPDRPANIQQNYPSFIYGKKDLRIVLDHYAERHLQHITQIIRLHKDGSVTMKYFIGIMEE